VRITKGPDGTVTAEQRSPDPANPQPGNQPPPGSASVEGGKLRIGDIELDEPSVRGLLERKGLEDSRRATMPASPDLYQLPVDMPMPPGMSWKWNTEDPVLSPLIGQAKEWAHANGIGQDGFNKMMGLFATHQLNEQALFDRARKTEVDKLGETAHVRVDSVKTWLKAMGGEHFNDLVRVLDVSPTAATVRGLEVLMQRYVSQGGASFNGAHREPTIPGKVSDETYAKMSYSERIEYASRFPQQPGGR
jgi:hypothetical protein